MKVVPCARIPIASIGLVAALLMAAPAHPAQAQANSLEVPSSSGAAAPASEKATTRENGKAANHHKAVQSEPKKKKNSFMHKMRDKGDGEGSEIVRFETRTRAGVEAGIKRRVVHLQALTTRS
jgi:spermidine/putrescine-binding protein